MAGSMNHHAQTGPIDILDALFDDIAVAKGTLSDDNLMTLMHLCSQHGEVTSSVVLGALRLLDIPDSEKIVADKSRRVVYKVKAIGPTVYVLCRPDFRHCTCDHFLQVLTSDNILCEHTLAARLADALGRTKTVRISDSDFVDLI